MPKGTKKILESLTEAKKRAIIATWQSKALIIRIMWREPTITDRSLSGHWSKKKLSGRSSLLAEGDILYVVIDASKTSIAA